VETSDHARLQLKLSYNWHFEVNKTDAENTTLFSVPDFCGDMCKAIASRVRGAVASCPFDTFHKKSARIIREAVFGVDDNDSILPSFSFPSNGLVITNIDIQAVEPVDQRTRDSLQKSVQLAIEITTAAQEAAAKHTAEQQQQQAKGELERQRIADEVRIEGSRKELIRLQVESAHIEAAGQASAEAKAKAAIASIEGGTAVKQAELRSDASRVRSEIELELQKKRQLAEVEHQRLLNELDIAKNKELSEIEAQKFKDTVDAIGTDTLQQIARAGPEMQAKLLQGLGLKSVMISDGTTPLNLFDTARGMISAAPGGAAGL
jgi:major vault protein